MTTNSPVVLSTIKLFKLNENSNYFNKLFAITEKLGYAKATQQCCSSEQSGPKKLFALRTLRLGIRAAMTSSKLPLILQPGMRRVDLIEL